jgi:hypothetical protein
MMLAPVLRPYSYSSSQKYGRKVQFGIRNRLQTFAPFDTPTGPRIHLHDFTTSFCSVETRITAKILSIMAADLTSTGVVAKSRQFSIRFHSSLLCSKLPHYL